MCLLVYFSLKKTFVYLFPCIFISLQTLNNLFTCVLVYLCLHLFSHLFTCFCLYIYLCNYLFSFWFVCKVPHVCIHLVSHYWCLALLSLFQWNTSTIVLWEGFGSDARSMAGVQVEQYEEALHNPSIVQVLTSLWKSPSMRTSATSVRNSSRRITKNWEENRRAVNLMSTWWEPHTLCVHWTGCDVIRPRPNISPSSEDTAAPSEPPDSPGTPSPW